MMVKTNNIRPAYFSWLCKMIHNKTSHNYKKLLLYLFNTDFHWNVENDGNREEDGLDLRERFRYEEGLDYIEIHRNLNGICSVLEVMVALALRCEDDLMDEPDEGDRTNIWFWRMISSLGLDDQTDSYFDDGKTEHIVRNFLNRNYAPNGKGGLFTIYNDDVDMREIEIWYQMNYYLDEILNI